MRPEIYDKLTKISGSCMTKRNTHDDYFFNTIRLRCQITADISPIRKTPQGKRLHTAGISNGQNIITYRFNGVSRRMCGLVAVTVPTNIHRDDLEIIFKPGHVTNFMPALPRLATTPAVQQENRWSFARNVIDNFGSVRHNN